MTFEISDDNGTIYSGDRDEMTELFIDIMHGKAETPTLKGDLKLIRTETMMVWKHGQ